MNDLTPGRLLVSRLSTGEIWLLIFQNVSKVMNPIPRMSVIQALWHGRTQLRAKNILLRAGNIITTDVMKATGDIILQSDGSNEKWHWL